VGVREQFSRKLDQTFAVEEENLGDKKAPGVLAQVQ
jgi:hypothetical protein